MRLARVLCFGPYHSDLQGYLQYTYRRYSADTVGALVFREFFHCGAKRAKRLVKALGIEDGWDFHQHEFNPRRVDLELLRSFDCPFALDLECFLMLRKKRYQFRFFYQPHE